MIRAAISPGLGWTTLAVAVLAAPLDASPGPVSLHQQVDSFPRGRIVEQVVTRGDSSQRYALYLPTDYAPSARWPVLFLMDPRGRALVPLRPVVPSAERHGWIVVSSYGGLSDLGDDPNEAALGAMLDDVQRRFAPDPTRLYLAGFSGTARSAWDLAFRLTGNVAGIMGFGGGLPPRYPLTEQVAAEGTPFVFFGGAGTVDFNFEEMWRLDLTLDDVGLVHRLRYYDTPHCWPTRAVFAEGIDWLELQAMKHGLRPEDSLTVREMLGRRLAEARELEAAGKPFEAFVRYRGLVEDFDGLQDVEEARARAEALGRQPEVRRTARRLDEYARQSGEAERHYGELMHAFQDDPPPSLQRSVEILQIKGLQRRAGNTADLLDAQAAQRILEHVFVQTAFYEPEKYLRRGDPTRALAMLAIAQLLRPDDALVAYSKARAYARLQDVDHALAELEIVTDSGEIGAEQLENDPDFRALIDDPRFRAIVERARRAVT